MRRAACPVMRLIAGFMLGLAAVPAYAAPPCAYDRVDIRWPGGGESFAVEVADDSAERAQGLMFRDSMNPGAGMLFVYEGPRNVAFWMRNTLIPLDLIFADSSGKVTRIHSNAIPLDETRIDGGDSVQFVLEINGGLAKRMGLQPGAVMRHPAIAGSCK